MCVFLEREQKQKQRKKINRIGKCRLFWFFCVGKVMPTFVVLATNTCYITQLPQNYVIHSNITGSNKVGIVNPPFSTSFSSVISNLFVTMFLKAVNIFFIAGPICAPVTYSTARSMTGCIFHAKGMILFFLY